MKSTRNQGFTLIELLVVISIISLLSSIVLASLNSARAKARDTRRKADLNQIRLAINQYIVDNNVTISVPPGTPNFFIQLNNQCASWKVDTQIAPQYIPKVPEDPLSPGPPPSCTPAAGFWYYYGAGYRFEGTSMVNTGASDTFILCAFLENTSDKDYKTIPSPWGPPVTYCIGG